MKKIAAALVALTILACFSFALIASFAEDTVTIVDYAESTAHAISFDGIFKNKKRINNPDGRASMWIDDNTENRTLDGNDGTYKTIGVRGWVGFNDQEVDQIGYIIDNQAPVFGNWKETTEPTVKEDENGGAFATRFTIHIDVSGLEGFHSIGIVAKLMDGTVVLLNSKEPNRHDTIADMTFNFKAPGETPSPEPTETPEPTAAPTASPAPDADKTEAPSRQSGCGSLLSGSFSCALVAICALIISKKNKM